MANIIEWLPVLALAASIIGSVLSFVLSTRQRRQDVELTKANTTQIVGSTYRELIDSYREALVDEKARREIAEKDKKMTQKKLDDCIKTVGKRYIGG